MVKEVRRVTLVRLTNRVWGRFLETLCAYQGGHYMGFICKIMELWTYNFVLFVVLQLLKKAYSSVHSSSKHSSPNLKQLNGLMHTGMHSHTGATYTLCIPWQEHGDLTDIIPSKLQPGAKEHTGWYHLWWHEFQNQTKRSWIVVTLRGY